MRAYRVKHSFDRIYFDNRWRRSRIGRPCDWVLIGISMWWAGPLQYRYQIAVLGFSINIWFKREFIKNDA